MQDFIQSAIGILAIFGVSIIIHWLGKDHQKKTGYQIFLFLVWVTVASIIVAVMGLGSDY